MPTLKYRRELTPNIKFQADRIFVRNDLFEKVIKRCKATDEEEIIKIQKHQIKNQLKNQGKNQTKNQLKIQTKNQLKNQTMNQLKNQTMN